MADPPVPGGFSSADANVFHWVHHFYNVCVCGGMVHTVIPAELCEVLVVDCCSAEQAGLGGFQIQRIKGGSGFHPGSIRNEFAEVDVCDDSIFNCYPGQAGHVCTAIQSILCRCDHEGFET